MDRPKLRLIKGTGKEGGKPPMDPYEQRFQAIEQDLAVIKATMASKEDMANMKVWFVLTSLAQVGLLAGLMNHFLG